MVQAYQLDEKQGIAGSAQKPFQGGGDESKAQLTSSSSSQKQALTCHKLRQRIRRFCSPDTRKGMEIEHSGNYCL